MDVAFEAFGADRIVLGSDWPVCLVAGDYGRVMGAFKDYLDELSSADQEKVLGGNAAKLWRLPQG